MLFFFLAYALVRTYVIRTSALCPEWCFQNELSRLVS